MENKTKKMTSAKTEPFLAVDNSVLPRFAVKVFDARARSFKRVATVIPDERERNVGAVEVVMWLLFGASAWWSNNIIMAEMPLIFGSLPEGGALINQLSMMTQLGNVFVFIYQALSEWSGKNFVNIVNPSLALAAAAALSVCMASWNTVIGGHSVALLVAMLFSGGVGCMTQSTYWPVMLEHPAICTKVMMIGMSSSGVVANMLTMVQAKGRPADDPRFSTSTFFAGAVAVQVCLLVVVLYVQGLFGAWRAALCGCCARRKALPILEIPPLSARLLSAVPNSGEKKQSRVKILTQEEEENEDVPPRGKRVGFRKCTAVSEPPVFDSDDDNDMGFDHIDSSSDGAVFKVRCLYACSFTIMALNYTVPTLVPFTVSAYPARGQQIMISIFLFQQLGEAVGRMATPSEANDSITVPTMAAILMCSCFALFFGSAIKPYLLLSLVSYELCGVLLPAVAFGFSACFGVLQTSIFLMARGASDEEEGGHNVSSTMGLLGQMGSLSANIVAFFVMQLLS